MLVQRPEKVIVSGQLHPQPAGKPVKNADVGTLVVGTLWCGRGHLGWHKNVVDGRDVEGTNAREFGELSSSVPLTDSCCRLHDYCPVYTVKGSGVAMCSAHEADWDALRRQTNRMELHDARWADVAAPFLKEGPLPAFVPYSECGSIDVVGGSSAAFASGCDCDKAFLECLALAEGQEPEAATFVREVYFHTMVSFGTALPRSVVSTALTTNVDRQCIARYGNHFVRDIRTDRYQCDCSSACGAGGGQDRAWCYTKAQCGEFATFGYWDFCDKFCFPLPGESCAGYEESNIVD